MLLLMKFFKIVLKLALVALVIMAAYLAYQFKINKANEVPLGSITIAEERDGYKLVIDSDKKGVLKSVTDKLNSLIYREATTHNPAGDIVPDKIDNTIKDKIKEKIN